MDTRNDGRFGNFKTVLSLRGASQTGPLVLARLGDRLSCRAAKIDDRHDARQESQPIDDVEAVAAFLETLAPPPNPHREAGRLSAAAARGETVFQSEKAGLRSAIPAPHFTDGMTHDVGLGAPSDAYRGYNAPSLRGVYDRVLLLHDGRARSLEEVLSGPHNPSRVTGLGELSADEMRDLLAYLRSI